MPFLNYSTEMLEPYIAAETVEAHYTGHHNNYRLKLNAVRKQWITEVALYADSISTKTTNWLERPTLKREQSRS